MHMNNPPLYIIHHLRSKTYTHPSCTRTPHSTPPIPFNFLFFKRKNPHLPLNRLLLRPLLRIPLPLLIEILPLLIRAHTSQLGITGILLRLVLSKLALLGLLLIIELADLGNLLLARGLDATHGLGAEVGLGGEEVGEAQEVGKQWNGGGVRGAGGLELEGELNALGLDGVVESGREGLVIV